MTFSHQPPAGVSEKCRAIDVLKQTRSKISPSPSSLKYYLKNAQLTKSLYNVGISVHEVSAHNIRFDIKLENEILKRGSCNY